MEDVIEASHNGIVAWENIANVQPILVEGQDDNIKTNKLNPNIRSPNQKQAAPQY